MKYGIDTLLITANDTISLEAITYQGNEFPFYQWLSPDENVAKIIDGILNNQAILIGTGNQGDTITIIVEDTVNIFSKSIFVKYYPFISLGFENWLSENWTLESSVESVDWFPVETSPAEGTYCVQSGPIDNSQYCSISKNFQIPPYTMLSISFSFKTSSAVGDYLRFYINDVEYMNWDGISIDWEQYTIDYNVYNTNSIKLSWKYQKDGSFISGSDCVWIDDINITW